MTRKAWLSLGVNVFLVLTSVMLAVVVNYLTSLDEVPWYIRPLQTYAVPIFLVICILLVLSQVLIHRLEHPRRIEQPAWDPTRPPYPGLDPFDREDSAIFFGRDLQSNLIARRVLRESATWTDRFVLLIGVSGCGKSSLVQAGVLPRVERSRLIVLPTVSPGTHPMDRLAQVMADQSGMPAMHQQMADELRADPHALARHLAEIRRRVGRRYTRILLFVDQLEELITLNGESERSTFLSAIGHALRADVRFTVVACSRPEFLAGLVASGEPGLFQNPVVLGRMSDDFLTAVVEEPGRLVNLWFAPGVVGRVVKDIGSADALPLLAYMLQQLYFSVGRGGTVTMEDYVATGGVTEAIARQAAEVASECSADGDVSPMVSTLLRFVSVTGTEPTRRPVRLSDLSAEQERITRRCSDARLLTIRTGEEGPVAEVTHEALFRSWTPLRQEIDARAELMRQRSELERWAADWESAGRSDDFLLTGQRLTLGEQWSFNLDQLGQGSQSLREYVAASRANDSNFLARISESIGRRVLAEEMPELSIMLALAAMEDAVPTPLAKRALLAAMSNGHLTHVLRGHAGQVAVRDVAWAPNGQSVATVSRDGSCRIWSAATGTQTAVLADRAMLEAVAWAPDSGRVAIACRDHTAIVWSVDEQAPLKVLTGAKAPLRGVAWSPDGLVLAATSQDRMVHLWRLNDGSHTPLAGHSLDVYGVEWSPDGTRLATASHDRTAIVWDVADEFADVTLDSHTDIVEAVAWSPDGTVVATASADSTIRLWNATSGAQISILRGHTDSIWDVAWSPSGELLASASSDQTIQVRHTVTDRATTLRGFGGTVWAVSWAPDGLALVSGSADGLARIWSMVPDGGEEELLEVEPVGLRWAAWSPVGTQVASGADDGAVRVRPVGPGPSTVIGQHQGVVHTVAWSNSGDRVASCANDGGRIMVWEVVTGSGRQIDIGRDICEQVSWSPDDSLLAVASRDASVILLDARTGVVIRRLVGHEDWVVSVAWSRSGRWIAACSDDRTARIWDIATPDPVATLRGHDNFVDAVAWSPDEELLVTASADGTLRTWDWSREEQRGVLRGHDGRIECVAWSADGHRLVSGGRDCTVRVWNGPVSGDHEVVGVHQDRVTSVSWSPDGRSVLSSSMDGTVRLWAARPDWPALCDRARSRATRTLTDDERDEHMLPRSAPAWTPGGEGASLPLDQRVPGGAA